MKTKQFYSILAGYHNPLRPVLTQHYPTLPETFCLTEPEAREKTAKGKPFSLLWLHGTENLAHTPSKPIFALSLGNRYTIPSAQHRPAPSGSLIRQQGSRGSHFLCTPCPVPYPEACSSSFLPSLLSFVLQIGSHQTSWAASTAPSLYFIPTLCFYRFHSTGQATGLTFKRENYQQRRHPFSPVPKPRGG